MKKKTMGNREYAILFVVSLVAFYTVLSLLGPFAGLPTSSSSNSIIAGVSGGGSSAGCSGNVKLSFFPDTADVGLRASAIISGLSNCNGKVVFVREPVGNNFVLKCSCVVATGNGCGCSFSVDNSACRNNNFYAQVDMNANGDYNGAGETAAATMAINGCQIV